MYVSFTQVGFVDQSGALSSDSRVHVLDDDLFETTSKPFSN